MNTTQLLKKEFEIVPQGIYAPYYYRYLGYAKDFSAEKAAARANGIYALFTLPKAHIYRNDLIVGSIRPLFAVASEEEMKYAANVVKSYGDRTFANNADHFSPDYERIVREGLPGLLEEILLSERKHKGDEKAEKYLAAMKRTVLGLKGMIENYRDAAKSEREGFDEKRLAFIYKNCEAILSHAPRHFAEGLQLIWFCHQSFVYEGRAAMALGRIDQYLYPLYRKDIDAGNLTDAFALELLENVFIKIYEHHVYRGGDDVNNICIGGTSAAGKCEVNELSYLVLKAVKNCNIPGPNLSARISADTPDSFLDQCLQVIGTGLGYPALMNDSVNIAALKEYGYEEKDVYNYSMVGCIENFITGKQPPWSDGRFDTPRFFEYLFNRGRGIYHPSLGVDTGDVEEITSKQEFMSRFETQLAHGADEYMMFFQNENTRYNPEEYIQPYLSCFCEDCIGRAKDINCGGSKYPSVHGAALMGVGTVSDSLAAIEKVIFIDKEATLTELRDAILHNFEGYEGLQKKLLAAPKYGNNDPFADKYAVWFVDYMSELFRKFRTHDGGGVYIAMAANISNIYAGKEIAATPDGRKAGEPLSDAASPSYGRDVLGATATINSITKPDYRKVACGTVINQKFSPSMFGDEKRKKLLALIKVYFKKGGQEMQINATSREVLMDAMDHPEKYPSLVVRVSGFSALYISLAREVQEDILHRTQQG